MKHPYPHKSRRIAWITMLLVASLAMASLAGEARTAGGSSQRVEIGVDGGMAQL